LNIDFIQVNKFLLLLLEDVSGLVRRGYFDCHSGSKLQSVNCITVRS